jgi:hypothetical protein
MVALYYLIKYTKEFKIKDYTIFILMCIAALLTKYTLGLILIPYVFYLTYKNIKEKGIKNTVILFAITLLSVSIILLPFYKMIYSGLLGAGSTVSSNIVVDDILDSNYVGNITFEMFVDQKNYVDIMYKHIMMYIGGFTPVFRNTLAIVMTVILLLLSASGYFINNNVVNSEKKLNSNSISRILIYIILGLIIYVFCNFEIETTIITICLYVIFENVIFSKDHSNKEIIVFFILTIMFYFSGMAFSQYRIANRVGGLKALHGRYFYPVIFQYFFVVIFGIIQLIKSKKLYTIFCFGTIILALTNVILVIKDCLSLW